MQPRLFFYSAGGRNLWFALWAVLIGAALLIAAGAWGLAQVAEWVMPRAEQMAVFLLGIFVAGVLPLSLVPDWRPKLARLSFWISILYGLGVWMVAFLILWKWLGFWAVPALFIAPLAAPVAVLRLLYLSDWNQATGLLLAMAVTQGIRYYAAWLAVRSGGTGAAGRGSGSGAGSGMSETTVIDTVVVETREDDTKRLGDGRQNGG